MPTLASGSSFAEVAEIIHAAVLLGPAAWGREPMPEAHMAADIEDQLKSHLIDLFRILHERKIPYVLVGGIAMLTYIEGRNTDHVDLVLSLKSLKSLPEIVVTDRNINFASGKYGELHVDFLLTANPLFRMVQKKHVAVHRFLEMDLMCATIEGLLLLKLFALPSLYRQGRISKIGLYENDIFMLCELGRPKMEPVFKQLKPFVSDGEMADLRTIFTDIQHRIERVDQAKNNP